MLPLFSFILFIGPNLGGLYAFPCADVSRPAGPQVAKYTLFLFVRFARSILTFFPQAKKDLWYCFERKVANQGKENRHLAGIIQPGRVWFLAAPAECLSSVWVWTMTLFQVPTCVLLRWSAWWPRWEGWAAAGRGFLYGPTGAEGSPSRRGVKNWWWSVDQYMIIIIVNRTRMIMKKKYIYETMYSLNSFENEEKTWWRFDVVLE